MPSSTQFTIRHLLAAMVVVAVVAAAIGPFIRSLGSNSQLYFAGNAVIIALMTVAFGAYHLVMRRRAERLAGEVILRAVTQGSRYARVLYLVLLVGFLIAVFYNGIYEARHAEHSLPKRDLSQWFSFAWMAWITAWLVTNCWWGVGAGLVELAEKGVIDRSIRFQPYCHFRTFGWNHYFPDTLVLSSLRYQTILVIVPDRDRARIEQFLKQQGLICSQVECDDPEPAASS